MKGMTAAIFLSACLLFPAMAFAEDEVIDGIPYYKILSSMDETDRFEMNEYEGMGVKLVIKKKGDTYYWTSRDNKKLIHTRSGKISSFVEPGGTGYVRIMREKGKCIYMEHLTYEMQNLTYWGEARDCSIP